MGGPIGSRCTRPTNIDPMTHLCDERPSIEAPMTENGGDPKEQRALADKLETTKLVLQKQLCVENMGASRWFLVQMDWACCQIHLEKK